MSLWKRRELLQGRAKKCHGGKSKTMVYAYPFTLAGRAVVATCDLTAKNLDMLDTNHWLRDPRNVRVLRLTEPAWQMEGTLDMSQVAVTRQDLMRGWGVDAVVDFFKSRDASGISRSMLDNSVAGADLLDFRDAGTLERDLKMTPFAARKAMRIRDSFLGGPV